MFDGRVVCPLWSPRGELLGFDSRHLDSKDELRFLLPNVHWVPVWINMPFAMQRIWDGADIVLVEGRYDVFAMLHAADNAAVLGSGPAHLSRAQLDFLCRWVKGRIYVLYDQDAAGRRGTARVLGQLGKAGKPCAEVRYGRWGEDLGSLWDRGGAALLRSTFPQFTRD